MKEMNIYQPFVFNEGLEKIKKVIWNLSGMVLIWTIICSRFNKHTFSWRIQYSKLMIR